MTVEIRPCRDAEELKRYGDIVGYVFAENDRDPIDRELEATKPEWTTCAFVDGAMTTTIGALPWDVQLNGTPVPMAGVTAVGTLPSHRRQGLLRRVMYEGFCRWRDEGRNFAILWASMGAIYQRFGYGHAAAFVRYRFDPRDGKFAFPQPNDGSMVLKTPAEARAEMESLYAAYIAPRGLGIHRTPFLWDNATLRPQEKGEPVYVAGYYDASGSAAGYLVYQTREKEGQPKQQLQVKDFVYTTMDAYRGMWEYMLGHDLVGEIEMRGVIGTDDPAPSLLLEPRALNRWQGDAIWMRVVDVESGLGQRTYSAPGSLNIRVTDSMCDWNDGVFRLETDGPSSEVSRTTEAADLTMSPNSLATLMAGHRSATFLRRAALLEGNDASVRLADRIFATDYEPHCLNDF